MTAPILKASNISFSYRKREPLLEGWSEKFDPGEIVAITGVSGRGKSTLLYILGLMLRPASGELVVEGNSVSGGSDRILAAQRAQNFGFVFQDAALDTSRSVLDNVLEGSLYRGTSRSVEMKQALVLLDRFGVSARSQHKPGEISGGQAQRIALCRALVHTPRILIADEPTGNLDSESSAIVVQALRDHAAQGALTLIATHDSALVSACSRRIDL